ncbi:MAG: xanthine phosphoribosyltransferase [Roseburia porci]|nr:xanthine phosphoribosyltransferase [Roseburia porci]
MKELEEKIKNDGSILSEDILKVDSFVNHQVDPELMLHIGQDFAEHFKGRGITKVVTIESSGIAPALMTAQQLGIPLVILKKQPSKILNDNLYQTQVTSYTKGTSYELTLSANYIGEKDHILIIDDFLANGEAATGAIRLLRKAHATIAGVGILIEKSFQPGREKIKSQGFEVYSLARVSKMQKDYIEFIPEE